MASEADYNIITGEPRRKYKSENKTTPHVYSYDVLGMQKTYNIDFIRTNLPKLGRPKDYKKQMTDEPVQTISDQQGFYPPRVGKLLNSTSANYNIITHSKTSTQVYDKTLTEVQPMMTQNSKLAYKQEAISKIYDLGRLYAPNINQDHQDKLRQDSSAFRIKKGSCAQILEIGKSYGPRAKLFRRWK